MRLINDRTQKEESSEVDFSSVLLFSLLILLGNATLILAPLPVILAYARMPQPWPRLCAIMGGVISCLFLNLPVTFGIIIFAYSLFVADGVWHGGKLWPLLLQAVGMVTVLSLVLVIAAASFDSQGVVAYWEKLVTHLTSELNKTLHYEVGSLEAMRKVLLQEGPFLILSCALLSCWLSVGIAAHLRWLPNSHPLSGAGLRRLTLSPILSLLFITSFLGAFIEIGGTYLLRGTMHVLSSVMLVHGCVTISRYLNERQVKKVARMAVYFVSLTLGFYVLIGVGAVTPLFRLNSTKERK